MYALKLPANIEEALSFACACSTSDRTIIIFLFSIIYIKKVYTFLASAFLVLTKYILSQYWRYEK